MTTTPRELKALFDQGKNITALLREEQGLERNTVEIVEVAYDLQTGSYIAAMGNPQMAEHKRLYTTEIAKRILALCQPRSILEAGVGEATTLSGVLKHMGEGVPSFGFDISWSRVGYANKWLRRQNVRGATLFTGALLNIPLADNSIDVVYTSHSIEPNGGSETPILKELYRVTRRFLVLLEPGYELAHDEARQRMDSHGYCKNLRGIATSLGYDVREHGLFPFVANPLNPTAITIIRKDEGTPPPAHVLACPKFKTPLEPFGDCLFSPEALLAYPVIGGIPCLRIENGIFASRYRDVVLNG